ncbi:ribosome silencing factor [Fructilactobacillus fructivorans]|uniref:ribosome silencing factor n=1 Tax=Fructilactobacillus fructivorans TaxID=1614 RepID=UPI00070512DA|nr:ribosome silencing factor [Fructilactobacillus fructivorans]KRN42536.1 iojap-like protein [Fructilactobacillus fructivorans]
MDNMKVLQGIVKTADSKRAHDIVVLDIEKLSLVGRYFVIMDAPSARQVKAIANDIIDKLDEENVEALRVEGLNSGAWVLIDLGDIIVHIFKSEQRAFYNLEKLWSDAPNVDVTDWISED